jgi:hypothetical protein
MATIGLAFHVSAIFVMIVTQTSLIARTGFGAEAAQLEFINDVLNDSLVYWCIIRVMHNI